MGPLPGSWLAAPMADLILDLQVCLSKGLIAKIFHSLWSLSVSCFHVVLGFPGPCFPSTYVTGCLDCTHGVFIPAEPSLLQYEVQILQWKPRKWLIGSGGDNVLWLDIADLSDHCPVISLQMLEGWLCQWSSLTSMEHCTPHTELYTQPCVLKEQWQEQVTGPWTYSRQFSHVVAESSQPPAAESMSHR